MPLSNVHSSPLFWRPGLVERLEHVGLGRLETGVEKVGAERVEEQVRVLGHDADESRKEAMVACRMSMPLMLTLPAATP
jgi:hypothetical protein